MARRSRLGLIALGAVLTGLTLALALACGGGGREAAPTPSAQQSIQLTSGAFNEGGQIPADHSCDGDVGSPDLEWADVPAGTRSLAVLALDPDAGNFVHWLVYGIPADTTTIPWGISNEPELAHGSRQGKNSFGDTGYGPLCPPQGSTHTYEFYVYALDTGIDIAAGAAETEVTQAMSGHVLAWGRLTGKYGR